ncbi:MAG: PIN domain-containing protein [Candidatus Sumerlaeota bacterium]|nr:PIN domain-containing protein [Candidatus Sumerlaeota bacterium]
MMLIDTSAWIEFFRKGGSESSKKRVARLLEMEQAAYSCPIFFELMAGARDNEISFIQETLGVSHHVLFNFRCWEKSADIERQLRQRGLTIPRDDIFVFAAALEAAMPILCKDQHFQMIASAGAWKCNIEQLP